MKSIFVMLSIVSGILFFFILKNSFMIDLLIKDRQQIMMLNEMNIKFAKEVYEKYEGNQDIIERLKFEAESLRNQDFDKLSKKEIKKLIKERNKKFGIGGNL